MSAAFCPLWVNLPADLFSATGCNFKLMAQIDFSIMAALSLQFPLVADTDVDGNYQKWADFLGGG